MRLKIFKDDVIQARFILRQTCLACQAIVLLQLVEAGVGNNICFLKFPFDKLRMTSDDEPTLRYKKAVISNLMAVIHIKALPGLNFMV